MNLASRLVDATPDELLGCIARSRVKLESYAANLADKGNLHGTELGGLLAKADKQVLDVFDVSETTFQVRSDEVFAQELEKTEKDFKLAWRTAPFHPQGLEEARDVKLLGGDNLAELFRNV